MKGFLILESGESFEGVWQGGENRAGEVVFNTSQSGYEEIATDPSYYSQIVLMTSPMMGNYGVDKKVWESRKYWIQGFMALQIQNNERDHGWVKRLNEFDIPSLSDLDTRTLTLRLREGGTPWGALVKAEVESDGRRVARDLIAKEKLKDKDWCWAAARKTTEVREGENPQGPRIAVMDFGAKENILRELQQRCSELTVFSSRATQEEILAIKPQGLMLTNGPGDPAEVQKAPETVRSLIGKLPIFGICMGHQILGLALGAKTYKLKFGHRGSNHPIKDDLLNRVYMTSQNHGYAVDALTIPKDVKVTQTNLNDMTVAGFFSAERKCLGIQYHPESRPGPHDAAPLFDFFVGQMIQDRPMKGKV